MCTPFILLLNCIVLQVDDDDDEYCAKLSTLNKWQLLNGVENGIGCVRPGLFRIFLF